MTSIKSIAAAIDYLESHLTEPVTMKTVAAAVGYSRFHFERRFASAVGFTPAQYLRKRRLSEAARALVCSTRSIVGIALEYQFQSQEAFARAFKKEFRTTPLVYRKKRQLLRLTSRVTFRPPRIYQLAYATRTLSAEFLSVYRIGHQGTTFIFATAIPVLILIPIL